MDRWAGRNVAGEFLNNHSKAAMAACKAATCVDAHEIPGTATRPCQFACAPKWNQLRPPNTAKRWSQNVGTAAAMTGLRAVNASLSWLKEHKKTGAERRPSRLKDVKPKWDRKGAAIEE